MKYVHKILSSRVAPISVAVLGVAFVAAGCSNLAGDCHAALDCSEGGGAGIGAQGGGSSGGAGGGGTSASGASGVGGSSSSGASGESGAAGAAGADGGTPCDTTKTPSTEGCLLSDDFAIFVAPSGKDDASGTKAGPVKTIAKAVELAGDTKIVIACDGVYDEQVKLTAGVKLYGGFSCPDGATPWSYEAGKKATVAPSARGLALNIAAGASAVAIEDFEFDAQDGVDAGESSVAAFVNVSTSVALTRVKLVAGKGVDGANGILTPVTFPAKTALNGHAATGDTGGAFNLVMCPVGGNTTGASGGNGGPGATGGGAGMPPLAGGVPGTLAAGCGAFPSGSGGDGTNAPPQSPASGATKLGSITPTGWTGASGTDGAPGTPGQGGGGGTGKSSGGGGGGGGAGGCGGAAGTAGKAGGSSIALLVLNSTLTMTADELVATDAGKGGNGAAGQGGQPVAGNGGFPDVTGGCGGGQGGLGGAGGPGGGAAGGVSAGIVYQGPMPTRDSATTTVTGTAGTKGLGGATPTNDGIAGVKQDVLPVL